ncbi:SET domain-containing protein [Fomitopsis serialis]|uniref:SET domain-containing protein n=1 Tax=Fomitopsis serialis TaxID=139415 RepID=UPI0020085FD4|nr:SET domain-containing protein [Neoantrodia serialis]KAH9920155.1 SET domain-containing protein [Neoantrodia serialis]
MSSDDLIAWFKSRNGTVDTSSMGFAEYPACGRGAVALKDIPQGHVLFTIPRDVTLSTRTSSLPSLFGMEAWKRLGLDKGWAGLILCMMWEEAQGSVSRWSAYLSSLPSAFDTPMFWPDDDIKELAGTAVVDKIGKEEAERDYAEKLIPAIQGRPELFPEGARQLHYSLERYHIMGSRILSRSFHVEPWSGDEEHDEAAEDSDPEGQAMDVDQQEDTQGETAIGDTERPPDDTLEVDSADSDDEGAEDSAVVAMVPMADMLNARYESENAKLFHEAKDLRMVTTKPIKAGEQIWNTYGDLPNSDLLRRYGHVDLVPVPQPLGGLGNPADVVEIRGDLAVAAVTDGQSTSLGERVDWWLENADDDTFVIGTDCELPEDLVSFVRLLLMPLDEWGKTSGKAKLPKPKVDLGVLTVIEKTLARRMQDYPNSLVEDEQLLESANDGLSLNRKHAIIVRIGEQRILRGTLHKVRATKESMKPASSNTKDKKRPREATDSNPHGKGKKSRR